MQFINRIVQAATAHSIPHIHPAANWGTHVAPGWQRFLTKGDGFPAIHDLTSLAAFKQYYASTDPLQSAFAFFAFVTGFTYIVSEIQGNASQVDRLWALLPVLYSAHFTFWPAASTTKSVAAKFLKPTGNTLFKFLPAAVDERMALIFFLQVLWSLRLHGNTLRRGFFDFSSEDYRWPVIRSVMPKPVWKVFNLLVVAIFQNALLASAGFLQYLLYTSHTGQHPTHPYPALGLPDYIIAGLFIGTLVIEQIADSQQQAFQSKKQRDRKRQERGKASERDFATQSPAVERGFVTSGLWAYSRHPNFLCEQTIWWILYLYSLRVTVPSSVFSTVFSGLRNAVERQTLVGLPEILERAFPHLINYSIVTAIGMNFIFFGSTPITEYLSSKKYPLYKQYKRRVAMFLPVETLLVKIPWLTLTGKLAAVDQDVFGTPRTIEPARKKQ